MRHTTIFLIAFALFAGSALPSIAQSNIPSKQEHPELFVTIQDSLTFYLVAGSGDTIKADEFHAAYVFDMVYDSTSVITYEFTECMRNRQRIKLAKWVDGRTVNANAALLSFNSTTDTFRCRTGDTISFYREIRWRDPQTGQFDTNTYHALDSLDYAIELVRLSDSSRVALLDSIGMLPSLTPSRPIVHGMHPLLTLVHYVVPQSLNNTKTFIRVKVYHRGSGEYWFTRHDRVIIAASARLTDSVWTSFIDLFSPGNTKIVTRNMKQGIGDKENTSLAVENIAGSSHDIRIAFDGTNEGGGTAVVIYDILGDPLFIPYMTPGSNGRSRTSYHFDRSGTFFVGLLHNNRLVALKKIIIN